MITVFSDRMNLNLIWEKNWRKTGEWHYLGKIIFGVKIMKDVTYIST